ncbi:DNA ligase 1 [Monomorium pharaonis]|uniref:DNA ligase 1 n=1 Tax=Monomorium pharaonis TaxID=307658 RepID=UPI001746114C|nr:DNA ligase 1 [Monomorium pharaonis]
MRDVVLRQLQKIYRGTSRNELSIAGHIPLAKRRSFSDDASRSERFADCEEDDTTKREVETEREYGECSQKRSRRRIEERTCERSRRKDTCDSSQVSERRRERKSKSCESYTCPELTKPKPCSGNQELAPEAPIKSDARRRVSSRKRARQLTDGDCSQKKDIDTRCRRQSKSYKHEDCEKSRTICKDSVQKNNDSKSRYKKRCENRDISNKERRSARKRSNSCRKRNSSRASNKSCSKVEEKRRCGKDEEDQKQDPFCEKPKRTCETKKKKPKCVKGPAKCMSKKKTADKKKFCQSVQKGDKKFCETTKEKSRHDKFCTGRKKEFMEDEKLKKEIKKAPLPCTTTKDKTPKEETTKQQIEREYKEINECKKGFKKGKKDGKAKMVSVEHKPTDLDNRIIGSYKEQQEKNSEKSASTLNESVISTNKIFKWSNVQSIINGRIPITKDVSLFNVMFDRLFSTAKPDYQDDFAIERTDDKMSRNYSANSDDFVHDDELPNYVEIEYEDEEDDVYDRATNRQVFEID